MRALGGLHTLMRHDGPILTDSGGYQVFSLANLNSTDEDGVTFQSHIDGARIRLTPASSMAMQDAIDADIMMQFDDVAAGVSTRERYDDAMRRSLRWAKESKAAANPSRQLFGIVQGGTHEDLRKVSAEGLIEIGFDGYAIGGLSVGESRVDTFPGLRRCWVQCCLSTNRGTSWAAACRKRLCITCPLASTCSTACCQPVTRGTACCLCGKATRRNVSARRLRAHKTAPQILESRTLCTTRCRLPAACLPTTPRRLTPTMMAHQQASSIPVRTSTCFFKIEEMSAFRLATIQNLRFYLRMMEELRKCIE